MAWKEYSIIAWIVVALWLSGLVLHFALKTKNKIAGLLPGFVLIFGVILLLVFAVGLWQSLDRPVIRTLAETRLWYSIILSTIGIIFYYRWRYSWLLIYTTLVALVFVLINFFYPDAHDISLMPALKSPWFIPHVSVYMVGYALLVASALVGVRGIYENARKKPYEETLQLADNIVYFGFGFLTTGLLFGALWAKKAWGHYWTWDPKETWALISWLIYLVYIHFRLYQKKRTILAFYTLILAFFILLTTWFGINYLPVAKNSVHTYTDIVP